MRKTQTQIIVELSERIDELEQENAKLAARSVSDEQINKLAKLFIPIAWDNHLSDQDKQYVRVKIRAALQEGGE